MTEANGSQIRRKMKKLWKCGTCNYTSPPTEKGYQRIRGHTNFGHPPDKRGFNLIDAETGEVLAKDINEAREKALLVAQDEVAEHIPDEEEGEGEAKETRQPKFRGTVAYAEEEKGEGETAKPEKVAELEEEKPKEITTPEISDGLIRYTVTLPADAWTHFNIARGRGYEEDDKPFDEWLWDCIKKRFELDYKVQLVLAPLLEE